MPINCVLVKEENPKTPEYLNVNSPKPNAKMASAKTYRSLIQNFLFIFALFRLYVSKKYK